MLSNQSKKIVTREDFVVSSLPDYTSYQKIVEACQAKENSPEIAKLITETKKAWLLAISEYILG